MRKSILVFVLLFLSITLFNCTKTTEGDLIITDINVIDVNNGDINSNMDVVIKGDKITSILKHRTNITYKAKDVINGTDKYLIPGLWDMHTHTWWAYEDFFPLLIANGVTGIREMFGDLETITKIRSEIKYGDLIGPKIYTSGPIVDGKFPTWDSSDIADTPEEGRKIVRKQKADGADFIKVYFSLEKEVYFAIIDEAKKQNISVCGHLPAKVTLEEALNSGHKSLEHFFGILDNCSDTEELMRIDSLRKSKFDGKFFYKRLKHIVDTHNPEKINETVDLVANSNTWISSTLVVSKGAIRNIDPAYLNDTRVKYMPEFAITNWEIEKDSIVSEITQMTLNIENEYYNKMIKLHKPLKDRNVNFLAGSDYPNPYTYPGFSLHEELQIFVEEAGFTPLEALQTATLNPAIFMEKEEAFGTVEIGKLASLLILNKNPLEDINNTTSIDAVILSGQYFNGDELRLTMEDIATKNNLPKIWKKIHFSINSDGIDYAISLYKTLKLEQPEAYNFDVEQLNRLGYILLEADKTTEAVKIFELNIEIFPDYANGYDSLGDAYLASGNKGKTIEVWKKAVELGSTATESRLDQLLLEMN